jgi:hypothetical protein
LKSTHIELIREPELSLTFLKTFRRIYSAEMREKGRVNMVQVARIAMLPDL